MYHDLERSALFHMNIRKATAVYFSPTGGTKKVVLLLAQALGMEVEELDITDCEETICDRTFPEDEVVIFGIPVYGGRVPSPALEKIRRIKGKETPVVLTAVYGNRDYEDALLELKEVTDTNGFIPAAAVTAIAEHSIMRRFAAGRPDGKDEGVLKTFGEQIAKRLQEITSARQLANFAIPGNQPYRQYDGVPFKPKAGKACTNCGLCAVHCPVKAIPEDKPSSTDNARCISCMRCIAICPSHARSLNAVKLLAAETGMKKKFQNYRENELLM